jgi:hypothetical protein
MKSIIKYFFVAIAAIIYFTTSGCNGATIGGSVSGTATVDSTGKIRVNTYQWSLYAATGIGVQSGNYYSPAYGKFGNWDPSDWYYNFAPVGGFWVSSPPNDILNVPIEDVFGNIVGTAGPCPNDPYWNSFQKVWYAGLYDQLRSWDYAHFGRFFVKVDFSNRKTNNDKKLTGKFL